MALDLRTRITKSFSLSQIITRANDYIKVILNIEHDFILSIDTKSDIIEKNGNYAIIVRSKEFPDEIVELTILYQEPVPDYEDPDEDGWWSIATIRASKGAPMKFLLAATLIVSISENEEKLIWDENLIWSNDKIQKTTDFVDNIKLKESYESIPYALEAFLNSIYKRRCLR